MCLKVRFYLPFRDFGNPPALPYLNRGLVFFLLLIKSQIIIEKIKILFININKKCKVDLIELNNLSSL